MQGGTTQRERSPLVLLLAGIGCAGIVLMAILGIWGFNYVRAAAIEDLYGSSVMSPGFVRQGEEFQIEVWLRGNRKGQAIHGIAIEPSYMEGMEIIGSVPPWKEATIDEEGDHYYSYEFFVPARTSSTITLYARAKNPGEYMGVFWVLMSNSGWDDHYLLTNITE